MVKTAVLRRRLPLVPEMGEREFFGSWVDRLAVENGLTRSEVWAQIGVTDTPAEFPLNYGVTLNGSALGVITETTAANTAQVRNSLLSRYDGTVVDMALFGRFKGTPQWARFHWLHAGSSSVCPACVAESQGQWKTEWKLAWVFGCAVHNVYLSAGCSACGCRWQSRPRDHRQSTRCANHEPPGISRKRADTQIICGFPTSEAPVGFMEDQEMRHVLTQITDICDGADPPNDLNARELFTNLIDVCRLVLNLAPTQLLGASCDEEVVTAFTKHVEARDVEIVRKGEAAEAGFRAFRHTPSDPLLMAAALKLAWPIVIEADPSALVGTLITSAIDTSAGRHRWQQLRKHWKAPKRLQGVFDDAHLSATFKNGANFDGRSRGMRKGEYDTEVGRLVPQLLWPELYKAITDQVPSLESTRPRPGRQFAAMAVLRTLDPTKTTWAEAAKYLGLEHRYQKTSVKTYCKLVASGEMAKFTRVINDISASIATDPVCIDFRQRREVFANFDAIEPDVWHEMLSVIGAPRTPSSYRWPNQAAGWVWETLTQGDYYLAPSLRIKEGTRQEIRTESQSYRLYFAKYPLPSLREPLREYASLVLERRGLNAPLNHVPNLVARS